MRTIAKNPAAPGFKPLQGKQPPTTSEEASNSWNNFGGIRSVRNALLVEQYHLCCYSEVRADEVHLGYHIEHIENKSQNPSRTFDPTNLAASAIEANLGVAQLKQQPGDLKSNLFGGHAPLKTQGVDMTKLVHPQLNDCANFFQYLSDGRVIPHPDLDEQATAKAEYTIKQLNLNSPYLKTLRRNWWQELQGKRDDWDDACALAFAQVDLVPSSGKLNRFFSLTRQFYGPLAEQTLAQQAPELL